MCNALTSKEKIRLLEMAVENTKFSESYEDRYKKMLDLIVNHKPEKRDN